MLYKEILFLKNDWRKYLLILFLLVVMLGYFIYKNTNISILLFLCFSIPGFLISLQTVQNSVMQEKNNGMFEKILTVHKLRNVLLLKSFVCFVASTIVTLICSGVVALVIHLNESIHVESSVFLCELLIALCADWTVSVLLVVLYMYLNQIIVINACVMAVMMLLSAICFGVVSASSMFLYTAFYCAAIIIVGLILTFILKFIPNTTVLK